MADYCCMHKHNTQELDDAHRLFPPEILMDIIGVVDPDERRRLAVVEDIARRLAGVLGEATKRAMQHAPPSAGMLGGGRDVVVLAGGINARRPAPPPFLPSPAAPWQAMEGHVVRNSIRAPHPTPGAVPRLAPASPLLGGARRPSCGTGVFLPRADAIRRPTTTKAARSPTTSNGKLASARGQPSQMHRHGDEAAVARRQCDAIDVQASYPELALPQEWTY